MSKSYGYAAFDAKTPLKPFHFTRRAPAPQDVKYRFVIDISTLQP